MGKKTSSKNEVQIKRAISIIAKPLFDGKLLERSMKLVAEGSSQETESRKSSQKRVKYIRRGVAEVTKALRKGEKGIVLFASDVHPVDIIAHLPVLCENKDVVYGYIADKQALGKACSSSRPSAVVMVVVPQEAPTKFKELHEKVTSAARTANPFFDVKH